MLSSQRWQAEGGSDRVDLVIASSSASSSDKQLASLMKAGALVALPMYVVEWLAKPKASLAHNTLLRRWADA